jgi:hypothetical protein
MSYPDQGRLDECQCQPFSIAHPKPPVRFPEEFRAPQAYESLGGTNPRRAGLGLWAFGILADAGSGAAIAAACPTSCFVPVSVRGVPVLRAAMVADSER